ncbi:hypothetical protein Tco_1389515 [Tanacetum coccineum]
MAPKRTTRSTPATTTTPTTSVTNEQLKRLVEQGVADALAARVLGIKGFLTVTTAGLSYNCWLELLLLLKIEEKVLKSVSAKMVAAAKLPVLNPGEFEL